MNNGYVGYSISNRALQAYKNGEKPMSKWTKKIIIEELLNYIDENELEVNFNINNLNKYSLQTLKDVFLSYSSWHHTSSKFNKTNFYSLDEEKIENTTDKGLDEIEDENKNERILSKESKKKKDYEYAYIEYEEWQGSRHYGKYVTYNSKAIIVNNWAYIIDFFGNKPEKKNIDGNHILNIKKMGSRKPKDFNTSIVKKIKKYLGI